SANAPVTIVEYASMSCPHCAAFHENVFPMLQSKYVDAGKVRFVFREFRSERKRSRDHRRICLNELSALRRIPRERVSDAAIEICRRRQGALRVSGIQI